MVSTKETVQLENPVLAKVREQLTEMLAHGPLTASTLRRVETICRHMRSTLMALQGDTGAESLIDSLGDNMVSNSMISGGGGISMSSLGLDNDAETFGARVMRELIPAITKQQQTPDKLMRALAMAKEEGETELAQALRDRLRESVGAETRDALPASAAE